jgi:hypothetical protein
MRTCSICKNFVHSIEDMYSFKVAQGIKILDQNVQIFDPSLDYFIFKCS